MQTRRDQVQAHRFVVNRLTTGMLRAEPDVPEPPTVRTTQGLLVGACLAVIVCVGAVVYGVVTGGGDAWRKAGTVVTESETGARFVYLDGSLHPLLNYSSARLLAGHEPEMHRVGRDALRNVPRGAPLGIPGAPDALPPQSRLTADPWQVCSDGGKTVLDVASAPSGGALDDKHALVVSGPDKARYLLWRGHRLKIGQAALGALGYGAVTPYPVGAPFLNAVAAGPELAAPVLPGAGKPGTPVAGRPAKVGQLFVLHVAGGSDQYYQLRREGLTPLTATLFDLYRTDAGEPRVLSSATTSVAPPPDDGLPPAPPAPAAAGSGGLPCVRIAPGADTADVAVSLVPQDRVGGRSVTAQPNTAPSCAAPDLIGTRPGHGVLAAALPAAGRPRVATDYLVTDEGVKYPVPNADAAKALGYSGDVMLPGTVLDLLPTGPVLDAGAVRSGSASAPVLPCAMGW
ncbi:type VII secretion protein EccB [Actinomadura rupiterrae]|uniref:type VII secretion protein EccB n=1 Tax=Actinomadura rupiterrae TaxID=559627 RepID=UPI0020A4737C|nr:type VII secretion protein EccB [Actinomadura rupiterrae]MCP2336730.1 type VII secretion protein EccB [Actinomadura rupiterrae]